MTFEVCKNYPVIRLEHQGENIARRIVFDVAPWVRDYGEGNLALLHQRPQDDLPYPVPLTIEDGTATWRPLEADMAYEGQGNLQLVYTTEAVIAKSPVYKTLITASLGTSVEPPDPLRPWMDAVIEARDRAEAAAETAEEIAEKMEAATATASIDDAYGTPEVTVTKTTEDDHINLDFAFKNLKGNGVESIVKTGTSGLVDTYTVTYSSGATSTFEVTNGNGIVSVEKTATSGLIDTYTITFDNGETTTFNVKNGNGIASAVVSDYKLTLIFTDGTSYTSGSIRGPQGEKGNVNFATFEIDPTTGILTMNTDDEYSGADFRINNAYLEVVI